MARGRFRRGDGRRGEEMLLNLLETDFGLGPIDVTYVFYDICLFSSELDEKISELVTYNTVTGATFFSFSHAKRISIPFSNFWFRVFGCRPCSRDGFFSTRQSPNVVPTSPPKNSHAGSRGI